MVLSLPDTSIIILFNYKNSTRPERFDKARFALSHHLSWFHINIENSHFLADRCVINIGGTIRAHFFIFAKGELHSITPVGRDVVGIDFQNLMFAL